MGVNDQHQTAYTLSIFPNPASTSIIIKTPAKGFITIHNSSSQQLITRQITQPKMQVDISSLLSGFYVVTVFGEKGVQVGKFVKQ